MRRVLLLAVLAAALAAVAPATSATTTVVSITGAGFVPKNLSVTAGDTVKWVNNNTKNEQVACAKCVFTSPVLTPTSSYSFTFKTAGKFTITDPLHNKTKGTVTVNAPAPGFSLKASPRTLKYLANTTLSGTIPSKQSNQHVVLLGKACGAAVFTNVTTAKTGTGGTFSVTRAPTMNTAYEAKAGTATSPPLQVNVQPGIQLAKAGKHKFRVLVNAASSFVGKSVLFQRKAGGRWASVKKVTLKTATTSGPTTISKKTFTSTIRHGHRVRITMTLHQTAPCYAGSSSNAIRS